MIFNDVCAQDHVTTWFTESFYHPMTCCCSSRVAVGSLTPPTAWFL